MCEMLRLFCVNKLALKNSNDSQKRDCKQKIRGWPYSKVTTVIEECACAFVGLLTWANILCKNQIVTFSIKCKSIAKKELIITSET